MFIIKINLKCIIKYILKTNNENNKKIIFDK